MVRDDPRQFLRCSSDTDRGSTNCRGVDTGSDSHWTIDANDFARWGVDYVKDDSCGGTTHGRVWQCVRNMFYATGVLLLAPNCRHDDVSCKLLADDCRQYATMRDALNATGRPMWYSITQILDYNDGRDAMHCSQPKSGCSSTPAGCKRWSAFTVRPWVYQGLEPQSLANSYLAECAISNATLCTSCAALKLCRVDCSSVTNRLQQ